MENDMNTSWNISEKCKEVFAFFEEISAIPHGSGNTDAIASYLEAFAHAHGLACERDAANNVLIRKAASAGYEAHKPIILQGHTDMVALKEPTCQKDMTREGLDLYVDGDFLRARGTTLGADDGIAVAYMLAILADGTLPHPPIEALFTSDEEIGLLGVAAFDTSLLEGSMLINIDSDGEGVFTAGCAGGVRCDLTLPLRKQAVQGVARRITVSGLLGGHSGVEIHKGRANALRILGECLRALDGVRIVSLSGGQADNAIASGATATVLCPADAEKTLKTLEAQLRARYATVDPTLTVTLTEAKEVTEAYTAEDCARITSLLTELPNGVIAMSAAIPTLVETSLNAGMAHTDEDGFSLCISVRSSKEAGKDALCATLREAVERTGGSFSMRGAYPAWEYRESSPLREAACRVFRTMYGKDAETVVIHAGLECGVFAGKIADFDAISLGPDNFDLHTPEEHLSISSTERVYAFLRQLLAAL